MDDMEILRKLAQCEDKEQMQRCIEEYNESQKPQTNADRIRAMSDEDLYKFCLSLTDDGWPFACKNKPECDPVPPQAHWCNECFMEWLKQPAQEG